jgi:hypothetical protein
MDNDQNHQKPVEKAQDADRREALRKLGKFSAYAAPFTVLAFSKKAAAATGSGPVKHR